MPDAICGALSHSEGLVAAIRQDGQPLERIVAVAVASESELLHVASYA